jgi:hypothetical protein
MGILNAIKSRSHVLRTILRQELRRGEWIAGGAMQPLLRCVISPPIWGATCDSLDCNVVLFIRVLNFLCYLASTAESMPSNGKRDAISGVVV